MNRLDIIAGILLDTLRRCPLPKGGDHAAEDTAPTTAEKPVKGKKRANARPAKASSLMPNRFDLIADLLLRDPEPREPLVPSDRSGRVYRVVGGRFRGKEHLIDASHFRLEEELKRIASIWGAKSLEFVREQIVPKVEKPWWRFIYRVEGGRFDGTERIVESTSRPSADKTARVKARELAATLTFIRQEVGIGPIRHGPRSRSAARTASAAARSKRKK